MRPLTPPLIPLGASVILAALAAVGSAHGQAPIADYLVMNVCVDEADRVTAQTPLECPLHRQRDVRPGEAIPYVHADFKARDARARCADLGFSRRFAYPLPTRGSDETGATYTLVAAWTDYPPAGQPCGFDVFDRRDTATLLAVGSEGASLIGAYHHGNWYLTLGSDFDDPKSRGVARFMKSWAFPAQVPPLGEAGWGVFERRTTRLDLNALRQGLPAQRPETELQPTIQFWKHIEFQYGTPDQPTARLGTLLHIPFVRLGPTGDAPGPTTGSEHFYLTRELGYVTRWENWSREDARGKDVLSLARKAYALGNCTKPATIEGQITPHLRIGPILADTALGVYRQDIWTSEGDDRGKTFTWYMTGCHDFTNVRRVPPFNPAAQLNESTFGPAFMREFAP